MSRSSRIVFETFPQLLVAEIMAPIEMTPTTQPRTLIALAASDRLNFAASDRLNRPA
ncbi:MAG: hypothetical protein ACTHQQ_15840 [Solirubrobacteraceae bacterium]